MVSRGPSMLQKLKVADPLSAETPTCRKFLITRSVDVHPTEKALIITYDLKATVFGDLGDPLLGNIKECQKIIHLRNLNKHTNCSELAKEVVGKCTLIDPCKLKEVKHYISYLKRRESSGYGTGSERGDSSTLSTSSRPSTSSRSTSSWSSTGGLRPSSVSSGQISINHIDQYVDLLYEDIPEKVCGSSLILQLAQVSDNLLELANNEIALSALSRVLREDSKKSMELSSNILYIFFCLSAYSQFHPVITQHKIGSLCMGILDNELRRYEKWQDELEYQKFKCEAMYSSNTHNGGFIGEANYFIEENNIADNNTNSSNNNVNNSTVEVRRRMLDGISNIPVAAGDYRRRTTATATTITTEGMNNSSEKYDVRECHSEEARGLFHNYPVGNIATNEEQKQLAEEYEKMKEKIAKLVKSQDQLFKIIVYLLMNLAEDTKVEAKMKRKNVCSMLARVLDRNNTTLLRIVVTFLRKLSLYKENVDDMADFNVVEKLYRVLMMNIPELNDVTLQLLFNLSFETQLRDQMVCVGFIPKLVSLLSDQRYETIVLKILYHLSMDDRCKSMFTDTDCITTVMRMLEESPQDEENLELIALCINLAMDNKNAQMMVGDNNLGRLMDRAFQNKDFLILKLIRNITQHEDTKTNFVEFINDIADAIVHCTNEYFVVECVRILGNMTNTHVDFLETMEEFDLIPWITSTLESGKPNDELVLEVVAMLGSAVADEACAMELCRAGIVPSLIELLNGNPITAESSRSRRTSSKFTPKMENASYLNRNSNKHFDPVAAWIDACSFEATSSTGSSFPLPTLHRSGARKLRQRPRKRGRRMRTHDTSERSHPTALAKEEDDEMVIQITYVFYQLLRHSDTRYYLIHETDATEYLFDLMYDKNVHIRTLCNSCLEFIAFYSREWADRIKLEKFVWHNSQWVEAVENGYSEESASELTEDDDDDDRFSFHAVDIINGQLVNLSGSESDLDQNDDFDVASDDENFYDDPQFKGWNRVMHDPEEGYEDDVLLSNFGLFTGNVSDDNLDYDDSDTLVASDPELDKLDDS